MAYDYTDDLDMIDAMVFSGDSLYSKNSYNEFRRFLARWGREVNNIEDSVNEIEMNKGRASSKLKIETTHKIKLDDLIQFIATTNNMSYRDADDEIDYCDFEGKTITTENKEEFYDNLIEEMKLKGITIIEVYKNN